MATIRIGSSETCDIKFHENKITSPVWAVITVNDKNMIVLRVLANDVRCFVNNNNVTDQYWIKCGDEICINGYIVDWNRINYLLHDDVKTSKRINICSHRTDPPRIKKARWRILSIIILVIGAVISLFGYIVQRQKVKEAENELQINQSKVKGLEKELNRPLLYGPRVPNEELNELQNRLQQLENSYRQKEDTTSNSYKK